VLVNPLFYVSEGMRAVLTPALPHMPLVAVMVALVSLTLLFMVIGFRTFERRAIS
jgi:ABC-2 type transport system permease protein